MMQVPELRVSERVLKLPQWAFNAVIWWKTRHLTHAQRNVAILGLRRWVEDQMEHAAARERFNADRIAQGKKPV